ncbi:acetate/propionate family kinase [Pseudenhygromyxa sp. WMMC2535]|uniref:acetate/propionate family kinase n=1 Tax=Pseudenhygromyxa sp. WMMC2535 TaxID=2712867 RepID=UPI0015541CBE|nr:acetate/propionate family kinase [Pseudenhygromyxa sp. WMMC2535]NVB42818.1 acetate/propionate family kinase [Pseudenhygromyxa sp. WMMC2535]
MLVLVVNCGSSSIKAEVIGTEEGRRHGGFVVERLGDGDGVSTLHWKGGFAAGEPSEGETLAADDHAGALALALPGLHARLNAAELHLDGVAHRVVHGGDHFAEPRRVDAELEAAIEALIPLAPLHNPANLGGIRAARALLPGLTHVAVFDTAFHQTLPRRARSYAIPGEVAERHGVRRYGFHGPSHAHVAAAAAKHLGEDLRDLRLITCHLGNGCSVAAVEYGRSVETSMGMTPLEGLAMGTRSGDIDPGALLHLLRSGEFDVDGLDELLNARSGLAGLSGVGNDMRDIEARAGEGDEACRLALHVFAHRLRKYIGAYAAVMGGVDAIVFTGGIGQNSALIRHRACQRLEFLGARLDEDKNRDAEVSEKLGPGCPPKVAEIATAHSRVALLVVATDEQLELAREAAAILADRDKVGVGRKPAVATVDAGLEATSADASLDGEAEAGAKPIPIAISARHVHLTQEAVEQLFGSGHHLTPRNPLSQPGQFACEETVDLIGPKRNIEHVRVLGPVRSRSQVEISRTDEFHLGIDAPVRASGDVANSPGITLRGPAGSLSLREGVICAWRHIHMRPEDAARYGVEDRDVVEVAVSHTTEGRELVFGDVMVRVSPKYALEMHIDTDEANAADLSPHAEGMLVPTGGAALLTRRKVVASRKV